MVHDMTSGAENIFDVSGFSRMKGVFVIKQTLIIRNAESKQALRIRNAFLTCSLKFGE